MLEVLAGVDVGGTRMKVGIADASGTLLASDITESASFEDLEAFLRSISNKIKTMVADVAGVLIGTGVGCPGRIDFKEGRVVWLRSKLEFLEGVSLSERLGETLSCRVVVDNDVNTILSGEMRFGAGKGYQSAIGITVGTGIGGALVSDGRMLRGKNWAAGHFGYMSSDPSGPRHICGNTGIFEEHASHSGIARQVHKALAEGESSPLTKLVADDQELGLRELFDAIEAGDPLACRLGTKLISELGVMVANLVYALDPELILVGGGLISHRPNLLDLIRREVETRVEFLQSGATKILPMQLGDAAGVYGGVALALEAIASTGRVIHSDASMERKFDRI
ncbi:ROK family protein [Edaphobacter aggregans]|uniref:ROK family protein n=1 Tax=Edaphobacter aggregans TaxID=570835 RepID=UPI00146FE671|nr:ROK family protein [Edaphobacter aggregans]